MLFLRVRNIAFRKALSTEQYQSADSMVALLALKSYTMSARVVLQCRDSLQELALSDRVWLVWEWRGWRTCKSWIKFCFCGAGALSSVGTFECQGCGIGYLNHTEPHGTWRLLVVSRECVWKNPIQAWRDTYWGCLDPNWGFLVGLITGHCPLNKHLHNMGLIDEPLSIASRMEDESAFHILCNCSSLIS
jgi:hypothetical protein